MKNRLLIIMSAAVLLTSCMRDKPVQISGGQAEREVEITLASPGFTRATTEGIPDERVVEMLDLLAFDENGFRVWRSATAVEDRFRTTLPISDHIDVYFVANCRAIIASLSADGQLGVGTAWEDIRRLLIDGNPSRLVVQSGFEYLPMWGQLLDQSVEDVPVNRWNGVYMLRSVASVDVYVDDAVDNFTLSDLRLYFVPDKGFIAPSAANYDDVAHSALAAESPADMQTTVTLLSTRYDAAAKSIANKLYLYDNDTENITATPLRRYTRLVLGGVYEGATYYYPIDFATPDGNGLEKIIRNMKYVITVNSVSSQGYTDPETASTEPMVGLAVNIVVWNMDESDLWVSGSYYLGLERRISYLTRVAGSTDLLPVRTNLLAEVVDISFADDHNGTATAITGGIANDRFSVEKIADADGYLTGLRITSLGAYDPDDAPRNTDAIVLTAGRIRADITVVQQENDAVDWEWGGNIEDDDGIELRR